MSKLQNTSNLRSFDYKSFETCESYLLEKIIKKIPFTRKGTRDEVFETHIYRCMWSNDYTS